MTTGDATPSPGPLLNSSDPALRIEPITQPEDITAGFDCACAAFGHQTRDGIWAAMTPGWDTPAGAASGAARMVERWRSATRDRHGDLNTVFLKATLPDPDAAGTGARKVVGMATWVQASAVEGEGDKPVEDMRTVMDLEAVHPGDEPAQRYMWQLDRSLHARRIEVVKEKAAAATGGTARPAVMVLDLCAVDPAFQRRGIARELVVWGLEEAQRRGGLEVITEASSMGRNVYTKLGFRQEGPEIEYVVDPEFADRDRPSNIFMRTGAP